MRRTDNTRVGPGPPDPAGVATSPACIAPVRLGPVPGHPLAPFHHAVVLRPPRQIPDHADAQADQPHRQRRRQVATRSPGIAVVDSHRCWSSPAFEATAEFGLHHSRGHLDEVTLGGKHGSAGPLPCTHLLPAATRSAGHQLVVSGLRHLSPKCRAGAVPAARPWLAPTLAGRGQAMLKQPPLQRPDGEQHSCRVQLAQFNADAAATPAGMLTTTARGSPPGAVGFE